MGAMRKAGVWLGLIEEEEQARRRTMSEDVDEFAEEEPEPQPVRRAPRRIERTEPRPAVRQVNRSGVTPLREDVATTPKEAPAPAPSEPQNNYRITTLHPTTYNEARTIGERYREGTPVIMNLSEMDEADAKRLVDFAAGLVFGLRGSFERVTNRVFLLSPANVRVTAEDKAKIAEGGFFNQ
ncbi:cell division protein SepF [Haloglycomyces albus]|uniref:cell division protein SepF n=1 Tax=Haloglycomyces albus TaxID=526067 RepID=UPI00046D330A|nr:cell division protein SepF [Haloglycomyces albus]